MPTQVFLAAVWAMLVAGAPLAQEAPQAPAQPAKPKRVCRSIVPVGSIMPKRFCLTKNEWSRLDDDIAKHTDAKLDARKTTIDRTLYE
jgi:hypothetical protein